MVWTTQKSRGCVLLLLSFTSSLLPSLALSLRPTPTLSILGSLTSTATPHVSNSTTPPLPHTTTTTSLFSDSTTPPLPHTTTTTSLFSDSTTPPLPHTTTTSLFSDSTTPPLPHTTTTSLFSDSTTPPLPHTTTTTSLFSDSTTPPLPHTTTTSLFSDSTTPPLPHTTTTSLFSDSTTPPLPHTTTPPVSNSTTPPLPHTTTTSLFSDSTTPPLPHTTTSPIPSTTPYSTLKSSTQTPTYSSVTPVTISSSTSPPKTSITTLPPMMSLSVTSKTSALPLPKTSLVAVPKIAPPRLGKPARRRSDPARRRTKPPRPLWPPKRPSALRPPKPILPPRTLKSPPTPPSFSKTTPKQFQNPLKIPIRHQKPPRPLLLQITSTSPSPKSTTSPPSKTSLSVPSRKTRPHPPKRPRKIPPPPVPETSPSLFLSTSLTPPLKTSPSVAPKILLLLPSKTAAPHLHRPPKHPNKRLPLTPKTSPNKRLPLTPKNSPSHSSTTSPPPPLTSTSSSPPPQTSPSPTPQTSPSSPPQTSPSPPPQTSLSPPPQTSLSPPPPRTAPPLTSTSSSPPPQTSSPPPPPRTPPPRPPRPPPPPPLPHTPHPLFERQPFIVSWNIPYLVCNRYNISLDTSSFRGVATPAKVPGQFLSLFYTDRLGLYPHLDPRTWKQLYGGIPQRGNLRSSLTKARADINYYIPSSTSRGLAVIDWEEWRPLWVRNWGTKKIYQTLSVSHAIQSDRSLTAQQAEAQAKKQFQAAARSFMSGTLSLGRSMRPNQLWGFYLFPNCYNYGWLEPGYTGRCSKEVRGQNDDLIWLWEASSALYPSVYLRTSLGDSRSAALMVRNRVQEALRVSALPRRSGTAPVFVYTRPVFIDHNRRFLSEEDLVNTIGESAAVGASGAVVWGASADYDDKASCEALSSYLSSTLNPYITNVTAAAQLCSDFLCRGNGRCVRKHYDSDHYLHLGPGSFRITRVGSHHLVVGRPTFADLKLFSRRFTCQCYEGLACAPRKYREIVKALTFRVKQGLYKKDKTLNQATLDDTGQSSIAKESVEKTLKV